MSLNDNMKICSEVTGNEFQYVTVDMATIAIHFGFPGADDVANMCDFMVRQKPFAANHDPRS